MPELLQLLSVLAILKVMSVVILYDLNDALSVGTKEVLIGLLVHDIGQRNRAEAQSFEVCCQNLQHQIERVLICQVIRGFLGINQGVSAVQVHLNLLEEGVGQIGGIGELEKVHHASL